MKHLPAFILFVAISLLFIFPSPASAQLGNCENFVTRPEKITTENKYIGVTFNAPGLEENKVYRAKINRKPLKRFEMSVWTKWIPDPAKWIPGVGILKLIEQFADYDVIPRGGKNVVTIDNLVENGTVVEDKTNSTLEFLERSGNYQPKFYNLTIYDAADKKTTYCSFPIMVGRTPPDSCKIQFYPDTTFTSGDDIRIRIDDLPSGESDDDENQVILKRNGPQSGFVSGKDDYVRKKREWKIGVNLGSREAGKYFLEVHDKAYVWQTGGSVICTATFKIVPKGQTGGGVIKGEPINVCEPQGGKQVSFICKTAIGDINTNPTEFIKRIFGLILSLSGGIALLLIIFSGYRFMTSQGNPEKIQGARETITSAIIGLLFIILSMLILQVIGVDILRIPGFG